MKFSFGGCQKCGYNKCIEALDFHHRNPDEKEYDIAQMIRNHRTQEAIVQEMQKCVILCANCHREFHFLERNKGISIDEYLL